MHTFDARSASLILLILGSCLAQFAGAAVVEVTETGVTVREAAHIAAPAAKVYESLLHPERWWNSEHTFSNDAANLTLDARAGGCFCERLGEHGSVLHLTVVAVRPGSSIVLRGALGPFQTQAVEGALVLAVKDAGGGADVTFTYTLGGHLTFPGGFNAWSSKVDAMFASQLAGLVRLFQKE